MFEAYILWKISYAELLVMNMDVSRYISKEELIERGKRTVVRRLYYRIFSNKIKRINGTRQTGNTA